MSPYELGIKLACLQAGVKHASLKKLLLAAGLGVPAAGAAGLAAYGAHTDPKGAVYGLSPAGHRGRYTVPEESLFDPTEIRGLGHTF